MDKILYFIPIQTLIDPALLSSAQMMPKDQYMALPPAQRRQVKAALLAQTGASTVRHARKSLGLPRGPMYGRGAYRNFKRVRGKGDFFSSLLSRAAPAATGFLGDLGQAAMKRAGQFITGGGAYKRNFVRGRGDYTANATLSPPAVPQMGKQSRYNEISYREYLGDVYSSVDFASTVFNINPGLGDPQNPIPTCSGLFPWLANTASQYEQYEVIQCMVEFISTSSDAVVSGATTSSLGQVCIATQYNTNSAAFTNLTDALNSQYATTEKPSTNFCHVVECVSKEKPQSVQYIRNGPLASGKDILQYDLGQINLITQGMPADGEVVGQLWITYKVRLYKPILIDGGAGENTRYSHYTYNNSGSDVTSSRPWGTGANNMQPNSSSNLYLTFGTNTINFGNASLPDQQASVSPGLYQVTLTWYGTATAHSIAPTVSFQAPYSEAKLIIGGVAGQFSSPRFDSTSTSTYTAVTAIVKLAPGDPTGGGIIVSSQTLPTAITAVDVVVTQMNSEATLIQSEKKFSNFWRGSKAQPTAPWLRGKYIHDRTKAPKRYVDYVYQPSQDEEHVDIQRRHHAQLNAIKNMTEHKYSRSVPLVEEEDDHLVDDLDEDELEMLQQYRKKKAADAPKPKASSVKGTSSG